MLFRECWKDKARKDKLRMASSLKLGIEIKLPFAANSPPEFRQEFSVHKRSALHIVACRGSSLTVLEIRSHCRAFYGDRDGAHGRLLWHNDVQEAAPQAGHLHPLTRNWELSYHHRRTFQLLGITQVIRMAANLYLEKGMLGLSDCCYKLLSVKRSGLIVHSPAV